MSSNLFKLNSRRWWRHEKTYIDGGWYTSAIMAEGKEHAMAVDNLTMSTDNITRVLLLRWCIFSTMIYGHA
ncbi:unnamed protein product [Peronospora belbahrii]|uniref:Uncharacterized protein n=1 Tax=Peronospora belbahrii TaxID=622444 RepID=A0AAU9KJG5_9STRA|nr:unnamed protein product [Peronospora belbahrii]